MHPCDARQVPAQLRHGEPVTEGQRSSGGAAAAPPASRRIIGTPITTLERSVPTFRKAGTAQGAYDVSVPSGIARRNITASQAVKGA
jgi:hypothetical protein